MTGLPTELKVSYWIWVIGGLLGLLGGVIGLFGALVLFAILPGVAILVLLLVLVAIALAAAQIVLAMKMKEGREWARLALTIVAGVSLLLAVINSSFAAGQDGNWLGFLISLVATVLMWVPNSQNWFAAARGPRLIAAAGAAGLASTAVAEAAHRLVTPVPGPCVQGSEKQALPGTSLPPGMTRRKNTSAE